MRESLAFIVIAGLTSIVPLPVLIGGGIALAVIILVAALLLFRNSGKGKGAKAGTSQGGAGWQPQQQGQQDAMSQPNWSQQGMGNPADNQWAQQQQQGGPAWNAQQQPDPNAWNAQQQQQGAAGWGMQNQQQPAANVWGGQQQPGADSWSAQNPAQQQPAANAWGQQSSGNQWNNPAPQSPLAPTQSPSTWGTSGTPAPGTNQGLGQGWNSPMSPQAQPAAQADPWGQQQPGAGGAWNAPNNPPAAQQSPTAFGGNSAPSWNQPAQPPQQFDQWGQPVPAQQPANSWGMQGQQGQMGQPVQQGPTAYGGSNAAPSWNQPAQADPWAASAAQPPATQSEWGQPAQSGNSGNMGMPSWQQPAPPAQSGFGASNPPGMFEGDKTMLRPNTGPQGGIGMVRVEEGKEPGKIYEVRKDSLSIGRSRESDIFLEDLAVSRLHASIVNTGNGSYALKDEGSANGTKVNGQMVNKYQTYPLQEGDRIQLGQTVLVFTRR